jgi:Zn-dependent protease/predicted transcriptional regulator
MAIHIPANLNFPKTSRLEGFHLLRILGFDVRLNLTWLLLALLIIWTLAAGLFPNNYPRLAQQTYWWMGLAGALGILFSIIFHELSHALVARHYGLPIKGITLFIFGGFAEIKEEPASPKVEFMMAIAGPVASFALMLGFSQLEQLATNHEWHPAFIGVSHYLAIINLVIAIFNLLPAFPLDGGRILRAVLWHWHKDLNRATRIAGAIGAGFGFAIMMIGLISFIQGNFIGGMWWFVIGVFLRTAASASYQQQLINEIFSDKPVRHFMNSKLITVPSTTTLEQLLEGYIYQHHFKIFPVTQDSTLIGCISIKDLKKIPRYQWAQRTVGELYTPCSATNTVSADTNVNQVISRMTNLDSNSCYMVVDNKQLVGMVSLKDLHEFISLKLEPAKD